MAEDQFLVAADCSANGIGDKSKPFTKVFLANSKPLPDLEMIDFDKLTSTPKVFRTDKYRKATGLFQMMISSPRTA